MSITLTSNFTLAVIKHPETYDLSTGTLSLNKLVSLLT